MANKKGATLHLKIAVLCAIVLVVVLTVEKIHLSSPLKVSSVVNPTQKQLSQNDLNADVPKWGAEIDRYGGTQAYQDFKNYYRNQNFGIQHEAAHLFGNLLYQKLGVSGLAVCDSDFSFGCYHSFFSAAIADKGLAILPQLDQSCIKAYGPGGLGCQHGIGHGLMEYFGPNKLNDALSKCATLSWKGPLFGCQDGVFMEYNFPILISSTQTTASTRTLDPKHPFDPCPNVLEKFKESCYYSLGQWWQQTLHGSTNEMGRLCQQISDQAQEEACYRGIGNIIPPTYNYSVSTSKQQCSQMPTPEGTLLCLAGASWSFFASPQFKDQAPALCENLPAGSSKLCVQKSNLYQEENING